MYQRHYFFMFHNDFSDDLNIMRNLDDFLSDTLDFNRLTKSYDGLRTLNFNNFLTTNRFLDDGLFFELAQVGCCVEAGPRLANEGGQ